MKTKDIFSYLFYIIKLIRIHGLQNLYKRIIKKTSLYDGYYNYWIEKFEEKYNYKNIEKEINNYQKKPLISIVVPIYNTNKNYLKECINSVINQYYKNWELILVDNKSKKDIFNLLQKVDNKKIKKIFLKKNYGISYATNIGMKHSTGKYIALLDHDDILKPEALYEIIKIINKFNDVDLVYSDEDKIVNEQKKRVQPFFKPCWGKDSLLSYMFINHLCVFKKKIALQIGGFNSIYDGSQDYEFMLRFTEKTNNIYHCPKILYHWRISDTSTAKNIDNKSYAYDKFIAAKKNFLNKKKYNYILKHTKDTYSSTLIYKDISYKLNKTIIIIVRTKKDLLLLENTLIKIKKELNKSITYLVINSSLMKVSSYNKYKNTFKHLKHCFYNKNLITLLNNIVYENQQTDLIMLLSPFLEILNIKNAINHSMEEHVGAVTGNIIDTKKDIISCGILMLNDLYIPLAAYNELKFNNLNKDINMVKNTFGAPKEFMVISTKKFLLVDGFDENYIEDDFFDIDICCSFLLKKLHNVYRGDVKIYLNKDGFKYSNSKYFLKNTNYNTKYFHNKWERSFLEKYNFYNNNLLQTKANFSIKN